ncbi:MAG TPA: VWA domain-containing protein [Terriglobia bacterium]|nr:VWA domain-containing protein [Terriglobia bacterium]
MPLFRGKPGNLHSKVTFEPSSRRVTIEFVVQDPNGYFIPDIHPQNFTVYENGVQQQITSVEIQHASVTVAMLLQDGGRYHELNEVLGNEIPYISHQFLNYLEPGDKLAVLTYSGKVKTLANFNQKRSDVSEMIDQIGTPGFSEANLYDALLDTIRMMKNIQGRKAIVVVTSGVDTFSRATFSDVLQAAENAATPVYVVGLTQIMQNASEVYGAAAPFVHIGWSSIEVDLEKLASASGGRAYFPEADIDVPPIFDDIMENLRLRYIITYVSSSPASAGSPRSIRIALVNPKTGQPLQISDSNGKAVRATVIVQQKYTPGAISGG